MNPPFKKPMINLAPSAATDQYGNEIPPDATPAHEEAESPQEEIAEHEQGGSEEGIQDETIEEMREHREGFHQSAHDHHKGEMEMHKKMAAFHEKHMGHHAKKLEGVKKKKK